MVNFMQKNVKQVRFFKTIKEQAPYKFTIYKITN